jgi:hypothetical protein
MTYDDRDLRVIEASQRLDTNEGVFFARQLEYIKSKTYDIKRVALNAFRLMPVSTDIPEGATTHTYRQYDSVGMAKVISNYATDLPRTDLIGKEFTSVIRSIGDSYGYNMQEIRSALYAGIPLNSMKATGAARAQQERMNVIAFNGDTENGLPGFISNANVPEVTLAADGTGSSKAFSTKVASGGALVVRDVSALINKVETQSKGVHRATEVWMPIEQYTLLASTANSTASDVTILGFLRLTFENVTFRSVVELDGAGASGADRMYAMENNIDNWQLNIPMMVKSHPPQQQGLEFVIPMESRFAGVTIPYPLAFAFADGI